MDHDDVALARTMLRRAAWLQDGREALIEPLIAHGRILRLAAGQWAQAEGDDEAGVLVMLGGRVQLLCKAPGDREVLIGQVGPGAALGQTTRFGGGPRLVTVICQTDSRLLQVTDRALARIAQDEPRVWEAVAALLYLQLRNLLHMVGEITALPPRQRLASRLEFLSRAERDQTIRISQSALAEMVGLTRKTANLHLAEFARAGVIRRSYGAIAILDPPALQRLIAG